MNKYMQIKRSITIGLVLLTIVISGCVSAEKARERKLANDKAWREETARNSEPIPPQLATAAAKTFEQKPLFIWLTEGGAIPRSASIEPRIIG